jgi:hypothetical protein
MTPDDTQLIAPQEESTAQSMEMLTLSKDELLVEITESESEEDMDIDMTQLAVILVPLIAKMAGKATIFLFLQYIINKL